MADDNNNDDGVYIYIGGGGVVVPDNVVRVRVHPSVTDIPDHTFTLQCRLEEIELCDGLLEIGDMAFSECHTLRRIRIPSNVTRIGNSAFDNCGELEVAELCEGLLEIGDYAFFHCISLKQITIPSTIVRIGNCAFQHTPVSFQLPDGIETIGRNAIAHNKIITNFRIPHRVSAIPCGMFLACVGMFSIEISETVTDIESLSFASCNSLRNVAIPPNAQIEWDAFGDGRHFNMFCRDLVQLFGQPSPLKSSIIDSLKHRFNNLPIHKMIYCQSYNNVTSDELNNATDIRISQWQSEVNPSGSQQDCLGMTPLHILACSTNQNIELYRVLIAKYPGNLIKEDRWGALPLLYAVWGDAPDEVILYLVESYKYIHPNCELDWTYMIKTLAVARVPLNVIQSLLDVHQQYFSDQFINWEEVLNLGKGGKCSAAFCFLTKCSIKKRVNAIGLKQYREAIMDEVHRMTTQANPLLNENERREFQTKVQTTLGQYETEYQSLKEATSMIELVLWQNSISEAKSSDDRRGARKEEDVDESRRSHCRVSSGADIAIQHVLPYLLPN